MMEKIFGFDIKNKWDYENGFYLTSDVSRMGKVFAHYELYKLILNLPGHVVECGVYKGASLIRWATLRAILENPYSRKIIGFDAFGKFPEQDRTIDSEFAKQFEKQGGEGIPVEELKKSLNHKMLTNYELIKGDIAETLPAYIDKHPELKISLLHVDVDVYKPTLLILENLYERVIKGGLVVFDDYGTVVGATEAIDEFFKGTDVILKKPTMSHIPSYVIK